MPSPTLLTRKLHAPAATDRLVDGGRCLRPDGGVEAFSIHRDADGRTTVRVEHRSVLTDAQALPADSLWHLVLAPDGRPERVEARWREERRSFEAALTCFPDEVLVWRRGVEPIAETLALPPGYRILWPPIAGRAQCLAERADVRGDPGDVRPIPVLRLACRALAAGGLTLTPDTLVARPCAAGEFRFDPLSGPQQRLILDDDDRLAAWTDGSGTTLVQRP